ncbi:MAG: ferrochelatase [Acidothermus sp.]|nr:ferrochelatase [Acidothermus sp.]
MPALRQDRGVHEDDDRDALLLVSFGGPEGPDDVMPFLRDVTAGRGVPEERLAEVAEHYFHFGGVSPINAQNRELMAAIRADFTAHGLNLPVYWGNRHWKPRLDDVLAAMRDDGITHAWAFLTSAYSSFSSCRQYLDAIERARRRVGPAAPRIDRLRLYFNHPGFIEPFRDATRAALELIPVADRGAVAVVYVAHSIPVAMNVASGPNGGAYRRQVEEAARLVHEGLPHPMRVAYCSRSGSPSTPWLEPDVAVVLQELASKGTRGVVVVPIGFVSDHMEVRYDLDTEAAELAAASGLAFARAATPGTDPRFVAMVRELVGERMGTVRPRALGSMGPAHDVCPAHCCRLRD